MDWVKPSIEEIQNFVLASLLVGAAFTAFKGSIQLYDAGFYILAGAIALLVREIGQRFIATGMEAYTELEISLEGASVTVFGAIIAVVTGLPVVVLFPVFNSFSGKSYEQWGRSIDAVWMKRQFLMTVGGTITLFIGWLGFYLAGLNQVAEVLIIFQLFQLMPFDYENIPTGALDGAYIMRWSGLYWIIAFGIALVALAITA